VSYGVSSQRPSCYPWEQFCRFAREPERRKVGIDARVTVEGTTYEVEPDLAGETVLLLWGLFDDELYVEYEGERSGPYYPVSGPIPYSQNTQTASFSRPEQRPEHTCLLSTVAPPQH
jgi:hypothetical protein